MAWIKFPGDVTQISVQQQNFVAEFENDDGAYFRAPDHFVPMILDQPGFSRVSRPEGAPEDLSPTEQAQFRPVEAAVDGPSRQTSPDADRILAVLRTENAALNKRVEELSDRVALAEQRASRLEQDLEAERNKSAAKGSDTKAPASTSTGSTSASSGSKP